MSVCIIEDCDRTNLSARGLCKAHYRRWQRHGDPGAGRPFREPTCTVPGCDAPHRCVGLCSVHYERLRSKGSALAPIQSKIPEERFWAAVNKTGEDECWEWTGAKTDGNYGVIQIDGKRTLTHRYSYYLERGEWPMPLCRHTCDNPPCVNPRHLLAGTRTDNMRDMNVRGRHARGERRGTAKITKSDAQTIRRLLAEGKITYAEASKRFGICKVSVWKIRTGRTWAE